MSFFTREQCLARLRAQVAADRPIIGGGAGTGISAKCAEAGGIDLIIIYNSGRFRMAGRGSMSGMMPYGDANAIVVDMAREVLPIVQEHARPGRRLRHRSVSHHETVPARHPGARLLRRAELSRRSASSTASIGRTSRRPACRYGLEVDMIRTAGELGLLTCPYVFNDDEARDMARAGADVLIPHMGLTTKGSIGARTALTLAESAQRVQTIADAAHKIKPDILVLCHGGPISEPDDAQFILKNTKGVVGFFGASSIERLPTEIAITDCVRRFKGMQR